MNAIYSSNRMRSSRMRVFSKEIMVMEQELAKVDRHLPTQDEDHIAPSIARSLHLLITELKGMANGKLGVHNMVSALICNGN